MDNSGKGIGLIPTELQNKKIQTRSLDKIIAFKKA